MGVEMMDVDGEGKPLYFLEILFGFHVSGWPKVEEEQ